MKPALPVMITPQASADLSEAWAWLRERNPRAADEWRTGIRQVILALGSFPEAHPVAPESVAFDFEIRRALYGRTTRWRIYYALVDDAVQVLHVRHGRREDWQPRSFRTSFAR